MSGTGLGVAGLASMLQYPGIAFTTFRTYLSSRKAVKVDSALVKRMRCSQYHFKALNSLIKRATNIGRTNTVNLAAKRKAAGQKAKDSFITFVESLVKYTNVYIEGKALKNVVAKALLEKVLKSLLVFLVNTHDKNLLTLDLDAMTTANRRLIQNNVSHVGNSLCMEQGFLYNTPLEMYPPELLTALHAAFTLVPTDGNEHTKKLLDLVNVPAGRMVDFPSLKEDTLALARREATAAEKELTNTLPTVLPRTTTGALNRMTEDEKLKSDAAYLAEQLDIGEEDDASSLAAEWEDDQNANVQANNRPNNPHVSALVAPLPLPSLARLSAPGTKRVLEEVTEDTRKRMKGSSRKKRKARRSKTKRSKHTLRR